MNGYPKAFLPLLIIFSSLLILTGLLLIPAFVVFRLEQDVDWLINLSISSGDLRQTITVLHAIFGWSMLWFIGALWTIHIRVHWRKNENLTNGLIFILVWGILIGSALGIYYFGNPDWSKASSIIHVGFGLLIPLMLFAHRKRGKKIIQQKLAQKQA